MATSADESRESVAASLESQLVVTRVPRIPLFVITLHRFAKQGLADRYAPSKRFCSFEINEVLASKWPALRDVERVTLMYKEPEK